MSLAPETRTRIAQLVESNSVMLFMKGTPDAPQCGFSATVVGILGSLIPDFASADVLADPDLRSGIKEFSDWPTVPQLYVNGEFLGGADIVQEMYGNGELHQALGVPVPEPVDPVLQVTEQAAVLLEQARGQAPHREIAIKIDAQFRYQMGFAPPQLGDVSVTVGELTFVLDQASARRADGMRIETVETEDGPQLTFANPNAPS
jgi:monothiol glutaredoxin